MNDTQKDAIIEDLLEKLKAMTESRDYWQTLAGHLHSGLLDTLSGKSSTEIDIFIDDALIEYEQRMLNE
jgi:hypothetical protein